MRNAFQIVQICLTKRCVFVKFILSDIKISYYKIQMNGQKKELNGHNQKSRLFEFQHGESFFKLFDFLFDGSFSMFK